MMKEDKHKWRFLFPRSFWTQGFTFWWTVSLITVFMFDIFWMLQTTFRPMSYFAFYPVLFLSAFLLSLPSLFTRNGILQTIWLLFFDLLFIANLMYCRTYYNAIPLHSYALAGNLSDFSASVIDSFKWYFIFLPLLSLGAFGFFLFKLNKRKRKLPAFLPYWGYVIILAFITWAGDAWRGGIMSRMDFMSEYAYLSSSITPIYSLGGFLLHDYYKTSQKLEPQDLEEVEKWLEVHESISGNYWSDTIRSKRIPPENLVIILCESLESWVLDKDVEGKEITPNLNRILRDSTIFFAPHVLTQVGSGRSIEGQLLVLTGLLPMYNKVYAYNSADNRFLTLPKAMKERGAKTILFTPDKPYVWNQARVAPAFGFDKLLSASDFVTDETTGSTKRLGDRSLMRQISDKLANEDLWQPGEKGMVLIVTNSGHNPFNLPKHLRTISFDGNMPDIIKDYMVTAHYTDDAIGVFINYLKTRPDWKETMVVITGDHEGLATDRKEAINNSVAAQFVDPLPHTPLIILNSSIGGRFDKELGQVDIYSTILDLMGLDNYSWKGLGFSIFDPAFPGMAIGGEGNVVPQNNTADSLMSAHLKRSRSISDRIIKFDILSRINLYNDHTE